MDTATRKAWRRERLIALLRTHFEGNQALLADRAGIAATLISRYISGGKGIGESMRDKIEANTGYRGWFDEHDTGGASEPKPAVYHTKRRAAALAPPAVTIDLDADCLLVWQQLQQLPEDDREEWRARLEIAAGEARLERLRRDKKQMPD